MRRRGGVPKFKAGVMALVVVVLAVYFAWTGNSPFRDEFELKAVVAGAPEVHSRTPVRIAGVDEGRVKSVEAGPGNAVTITLALKRSALPIHDDATLKIRTRLFLEGNFFIDLHPGSPGAPVAHEGHVIPLSNTAVPVQLDEILSDFTNSTRESVRVLIGELARALDHGGAEALGRALPDLAPALRHSAQTSEALRGLRDGDLGGAIRYSERVSAALASGERQLPELVTGLNRTARALAVRRAELEASLPELDGLLAEAGPALDELRRLTPEARAFIADLRPGLRAAPATLRLAGPFLTQADRLLTDVPPLLRQADPAFRSLAQLEPNLRATLRLAYPATECLRRNAVPTLKTPVVDPPHSTGDPVYQDLIHSVVGQASASQDFDGDGPAVRYHAGFGEQSISFGSGVPAVSSDPLVALADEPLLGSRPRRPPRQPPFRPDVPCMSQRLPDLHAETGPAPPHAPVELRAGGGSATPRELRRELRRRVDKLIGTLR